MIFLLSRKAAFPTYVFVSPGNKCSVRTELWRERGAHGSPAAVPGGGGMSDLLQPSEAVLGTGLSRSAGCTLQPVHKISMELKVNICLALPGEVSSPPAIQPLPSFLL